MFSMPVDSKIAPKLFVVLQAFFAVFLWAAFCLLIVFGEMEMEERAIEPCVPGKLNWTSIMAVFVGGALFNCKVAFGMPLI